MKCIYTPQATPSSGGDSLADRFSAAARLDIANEESLRQLVPSLLPFFRSGECIGLSGDLGAGKTTLTRYVVKALGSSVQASSPSYTLAHEYPIPDGVMVEHWDLYRLAAAPDELFEPSTAIRILEWPERAPELEEFLSSVLVLETTGSSSRVLTVYSNYDQLIAALSSELLGGKEEGKRKK